jgi:hypothetical protein
VAKKRLPFTRREPGDAEVADAGMSGAPKNVFSRLLKRQDPDAPAPPVQSSSQAEAKARRHREELEFFEENKNYYFGGDELEGKKSAAAVGFWEKQKEIFSKREKSEEKKAERAESVASAVSIAKKVGTAAALAWFLGPIPIGIALSYNYLAIPAIGIWVASLVALYAAQPS